MNKTFTIPRIAGIAAVIPKEKLVLMDLAQNYGAKTIEKIINVTGISEVRLAPAHKTSSDYCVVAAKNLLKQLALAPAEIDGIVFVTETPDYLVPHTSAVMQDKLGIATSALAFDLNYGCAGYVYGLFQAFMLVQLGYCKNVLFCAGDTLSHYVNSKDKALRMVLGDAGSATLITAGDSTGETIFSFFTDGAGAKHLIIPAGGNRCVRQKGITDVLEQDADGNARTQEDLYMDGMEIMQFALHEVKKVIEKTIEQVGWDKTEIDLYAFHQANELIVKYLGKQLKLDMNKVPMSVGKTGNTSSVSIPLMLCNLYSEKQEKLKKVIACGFGTGLSCAAGAIDLSGAQICPTQEI